MPSVIKKRSYYDYHEMEGGMWPLDEIKDALKNTFTAERFSGEMHAREGLMGRPYSFVGPGTNLSRRLDRRTGLPKPSSQPINRIDEDAMRHDIRYGEIADEYHRNPTPENRTRKLQQIHDEDEVFIRNVRQHRDDDPAVAKVASALITAKRFAEQHHLLDSRKFSGFGKKPRINIVDEASDPVHRLRELAIKQNKKFEPKNQRGGFAIPAFLIPILASAASTLVGKIYDTIKQKIEGKGLKLPHHKTIKQKRQYLIHIAKHSK